MNEIVFREYDIRGEVGTDFKIEDVYTFGRALAAYIQEKDPSCTALAIARDGRTHSEAIEKSLIEALVASGLQVVSLGLVPSPALYFALHALDVDGGVMITASHNPASDNGFKICVGEHEIWGASLKELYQWYVQKKEVHPQEPGAVAYYPIVPVYIAWLCNAFPSLHGIDARMVIDCGNAAGAVVIPPLVEALGWKHAKVICDTIDGTFSKHEADPTKLSNMLEVQALLATGEYEIGFGLDGDADRVGVMTPDGELLGGDVVLGYFAQSIIPGSEHKTVIHDVIASKALGDYITFFGGRAVMSPVGHANIKDRMRDNAAALGGEISGHFMFTDRYFGYDDGIYALLRFVEIMQECPAALAATRDAFKGWYTSPAIRIDCAEDQKVPIIKALKSYFADNSSFRLIDVDGVRIENEHGWALVRSSNTQPKLSLRFEADAPEALTELEELIRDLLKPYHLTF